MKNALIIMLSMLILVEIQANSMRNLKVEEDPPEPPSGDDPPGPPPGPGGDDQNSYDYSNYQAVSINEELKDDKKASSNSDESVVYINTTGILITSSELTKEDGVSSNIENSEFYGVNAAVLVQGGEATITGGSITTKAKGANALCATNNAKVVISGTTITSTAQSSARGLHATYGGEITASKVSISSIGDSCANLANDRGEGVVTCTECTLSTGGKGSPLIYSTGEITVSKTTGEATVSQNVVVEGKNTATVKDESSLKCAGLGNRNEVDNCGVFLYQSMSGDAGEGTATFNCKDSSLEIVSTSSAYDTAPFFFVTNTQAVVNLENCTISYGSLKFLTASATSEWGNEGSNGGKATLNLKNQQVEGDLTVDGVSTLELVLENSKFVGKINNDKKASKLTIKLDSNSKITLTGDSYYTSLTNGDSNGKNIDNGGYKFEKYGSSSSGSWIKMSMLLVLIILF